MPSSTRNSNYGNPNKLRSLQSEGSNSSRWRIKVKFRIRTAFATVASKFGGAGRDSEKRLRTRRNLYSMMNNVHTVSSQSEQYPMNSMETPRGCEILDAGVDSLTGIGVRSVRLEQGSIRQQNYAESAGSRTFLPSTYLIPVNSVQLVDSDEPDDSVSHSLTPEMLDSQTKFKMVCEDARDAFSLCSSSFMSICKVL